MAEKAKWIPPWIKAAKEKKEKEKAPAKKKKAYTGISSHNKPKKAVKKKK